MEYAKTIIDTAYGKFDFFCFRWGAHEEDNILVLSVGKNWEKPLVRIQSACYTAEIFRSKDCDCHEQLETSLRRIQGEGGLFVYMLCDGRGAGLYLKVQGLELGRIQQMDTADAYAHLGLKLDPREYGRVVQLLNHFEITSLRLLTNNPRKVEGLAKAGILVTREPLEILATDASASYLRTKAFKMGHLMHQFETDDAPSHN